MNKEKARKDIANGVTFCYKVTNKFTGQIIHGWFIRKKMSTGYTKLFASIVTSTIWIEDDQTRIIWITMLALADKNGEVQASVPGLARVAGVPVGACEVALEKFLSPDAHSRTKDDGGRRIEVIDGGWMLLNHRKYREMAGRDEAAESNRVRQRQFRERKRRNELERGVTGSNKNNGSNANLTDRNATVTHTLHIAEADPDTEAESEKIFTTTSESNPDVRVERRSKAKPSRRTAQATTSLDSEFLEELQKKPAYERLNVAHINLKMCAWCEVNGKQATRRRLINWLNREDQPIAAGPAKLGVLGIDPMTLTPKTRGNVAAAEAFIARGLLDDTH